MAVVISSDNIDGHSVDKYNFKVLASQGQKKSLFDTSSTEEASGQNSSQTPQASIEPAKESGVDSSALSQSSKDSLIESLMKKTDDMSSNFIKLQMKLEAKEEEFEGALKQAKEQSFQEGVTTGIQQAQSKNEGNITQTLSQFSASVATLEKSAKEYEVALENIKAELMSAAVDIAKEVVNSELSENSNNIAQLLAQELIKELQSASKITLKVNPKNHGVVSENVGKLEHIEIISDSAVSEGGVIAMSDAGNIDAQISKRFERVKRAVLSE